MKGRMKGTWAKAVEAAGVNEQEDVEWGGSLRSVSLRGEMRLAGGRR